MLSKGRRGHSPAAPPPAQQRTRDQEGIQGEPQGTSPLRFPFGRRRSGETPLAEGKNDRRTPRAARKIWSICVNYRVFLLHRSRDYGIML